MSGAQRVIAGSLRGRRILIAAVIVVVCSSFVAWAPILAGPDGCRFNRDDLETDAATADARCDAADVELTAFAERVRQRWPDLHVTCEPVNMRDDANHFVRMGVSSGCLLSFYVDRLEFSRFKGSLSLTRDGGVGKRHSIVGIVTSACRGEVAAAVGDEFVRLDAILHGKQPTAPVRLE